jgi:hypothetical protein
MHQHRVVPFLEWPARSWVVAIAVLAAALSACPSPAAPRTDPLGGTGGGPIAGSLSVRVVQDGTTDPIPYAFIMAGPREGEPFWGNWAITDESGQATMVSPDLQGPLDVTAGANGYRYFTLVGVNANDIVLALRPIASTAPAYQVGDYVSGIDVNNGTMHYGDGNLDMALVLPMSRAGGLTAFNVGNAVAVPETILVLGQPVVVPSNVFIPQQWEVFVEIVKAHYALHLEPGDYTLTAISGRVPLDVLLGGGDLTALLAAMDWREVDVLDITVNGDTNAADLTVDPDLVDTITMNLANVPSGSTTMCFSAGDLDNQAGLGRLAPLGIRSFACAGGGAPCSGAVSLSTTAPAGEFAGTGYLAAATVYFTDTEDALVLLDRGPYPQSFTTTMSSFFHLLEPAYADGEFTWNDAADSAAGSPPVHLQMADIGNLEGTEIYWELMIPGGLLEFGLPALPPEAPPAPLSGGTYRWEQAAAGLGYALPAFDYNAFAFSDVAAHVTHLATDALGVALLYDPQGTPDPAGARAPRLALSGAAPSPFHDATCIRFELARATPVDLAIYGVDGRRIVTLLQGERAPGGYEVVWAGTDARGRAVPSGVYWARLNANGERGACTVILQR